MTDRIPVKKVRISSTAEQRWLSAAGVVVSHGLRLLLTSHASCILCCFNPARYQNTAQNDTYLHVEFLDGIMLLGELGIPNLATTGAAPS